MSRLLVLGPQMATVYTHWVDVPWLLPSREVFVSLQIQPDKKPSGPHPNPPIFASWFLDLAPPQIMLPALFQ